MVSPTWTVTIGISGAIYEVQIPGTSYRQVEQIAKQQYPGCKVWSCEPNRL